ncbi:MAG: SpoIIE family protein phosphatase [Planctomycetota bacterium]|nr:SpoIIE family protein phosphatase [Planctomycetota bacterium]
MKLNIVMKFILAVGLPMVVIYAIMSLAQFRSMTDLVQREGSLRSHVAAEQVANYLNSRLITVGTAARSLVEFAELDTDAAKRLQVNLLMKLLEAEVLIDSTAIAWGDPRAGSLTGWRVHRLDDRIASSSLGLVDGQQIVQDYKRCHNPKGGWVGPLTATADLPLRCEYIIPLEGVDEILGLLSVAINLHTLDEQTIKSLPTASRFVILNNNWVVMSSSTSEDIGKPLADTIKEPDQKNLEPFFTKVTTERRAGATSNATPIPTDFDGHMYWVAWAVMDEPDWILVDAIPQSVMLEPVYSLLERDTIIRLIGIVVIILAIIISSLLLTRRIRRLHTAMEIARQGDLQVRVTPGRGQDEITRLGQGFNQMLSAFSDNLDALASSEAERMAVDRELDIARNIQESLQPELPPRFSHRVNMEIAAVNLPAHHVGGDFYDYWILDDEHLAFMLGDVSGKGAPAALFMAVTRTTIRMVAGRERDPARILELTNQYLQEDNKQGLFVTLFLGVCNVNTGKLHYANAGHHPAIVKPASGSMHIEGEATGTILGTLPDAGWQTKYSQLKPGDHFILYTDGLTEAHGGDDKMIDLSGVQQHLKNSPCLTAQGVCDDLVAMAVAIQDDQLFDDVTVMDLYRHTSSTPPAASGESDGSGERT